MGGIIGDIISFVGRPFGIYTHNEVFSDIQISNLLTPGVATDMSKRNARYYSNGDIQSYQEGIRSFQRDYRKKYSKKFLENVGYNPTSHAEARAIENSKVLTYIQSIDPTATAIIYAKDKYMTRDEHGRWLMESEPGDWDNSLSQYTLDGKLYLLESFSEGVTVDKTVADFTREYTETIKEYLHANYVYDEIANTITITELRGSPPEPVDIVYDLDPFTEMEYDDGGTPSYKVTGTSAGEPDLEIYVPIETLQLILTSSLIENECSVVKYQTSDGDTKYWIGLSDTQDFYGRLPIDMTAIIAMKEDNVMVDIENDKLKRMLRKLNLSGDQLQESLENPDMDGAYLFTGIDPQTEAAASIKTMFNMFDLMPIGDGNVNISIDKLAMSYSFNIVKNTVTGSVADIGTYTKSITGSGLTAILTLRYQGSASEYQELIITEFTQKYTISGEIITAHIDSTGGYCRLLLPLDILNGLRYKDFVTVYEESLCMLAFSTEVVEVQWYETGAFGTLLKIVAIVLTVISIMTTGFDFGKFLTDMLINTLIMEAAIMLGEAIGGDFGAVVAGVAAVWAMTKAGSYKGKEGSELWLKMANDGLSTVAQVVQHEMQNIVSQGQAALKVLEEQMEDLQEKMKEYEEEGDISYTPIGSTYVGTRNPMFRTTEEYVNSIVNTDWLVSSGWLYDIDGNIARRNTVVMGVG